MYTTKEVMVCGMQLPNDLLTDAIEDTRAYKDYVEVYERVKVPTILCVSDISELRLQEHWYMLVLVTSGDARSSNMISGDAKSWIMPPMMMTRSASQLAAASRGGGTGGRASRGCGMTRCCSSDQGDGRIDWQGGQVGGQGSEVNDGVNGVSDFSTIIAQ
ncbi:hypothetical protein Tco_1346384 [Tanacetum coccineum]